MKRLCSILILVLGLPALALGEAAQPAALSAGAQGSESPSTVSAVGRAVVSVVPDTAVLTFHSAATGLSVAQAQSDSLEKSQALCDALKALGIGEEALHVSSYQVETVYSYQYGKLGEGEIPAGYSVRWDVVVRHLSLIHI